MEKEDLKKELLFIFIRSLFLNLAAYLISVVFIGFTFSMAAGLLLGTSGMLFNLFLLNMSVNKIVKSGGIKSSSRMFGGYIARMFIIMALISVTMFFELSCTIGAVIPYFYPKLIYAEKHYSGKGEDL